MKLLIRIACTLGVLVLFLWYVGRSISLATLAAVHVQWWWFAAAWAMLQLSFLLSAYVLKYSFSYLGGRIGFPTAYCIYFISNLGRYVPGRIWQFMVMTLFARKRGISVLASSSIFLFNQLAVLAAGVLFSLVLAKGISPLRTQFAGSLIYPMTPILLVFVAPNLAVHLLNSVLRRFGRKGQLDKIGRTYSLRLLGYYLLVQLFNGTGFILLARAVGLPHADGWFMLSIYPLAYIIGYVSLITPGGIGIRESFMLFLLKRIYSPEQAAVLAVASLVWFSGLEILNGLFSLFIYKSGQLTDHSVDNDHEQKAQVQAIGGNEI